MNDALTGAFSAYPDHVAIYTQDNQQVTFARLQATVLAFAGHLSAGGVSAGMHVLPMVDNAAVRIGLILALLRIGAVPVMADNPVAPMAAGVRVDLAVALPDQFAGDTPVLNFSQAWASPAPAPARDAKGLFFGSSGSTGAPKYLFRSADSLMALVAHRQGHAGAVAGPVFLGMAVTTQVSFQVMLAAFLQGHGVIFPTGSPATTLEQMAKHKITDAMLAPILLERLVEAAGQAAALPALQRLVVGGAAARSDVLVRATEIFGTPPICLMGSTEAGLIGGGVWPGPNAEPGFLGPLADGVEAVFRDVDGKAVPIGTEGRMFLRPLPSHRVPAYADGKPISDASGWINTGDIAWTDAGGLLTILGREDDRLSVGGIKLAPRDLEDLFFDLAGNRRLVVTSDGRRLGLVVEGRRDTSDATLITRAALRLGNPIPMVLKHVARLPETASGKLDRKALPALLQSPE